MLLDGTQREVFTPEMDHPVVAEVYTIPEAARAIGRSELTIKRWLMEDLIPGPILTDTVRRYRHYSRGELEIIARILADHEREFAYYTAKHEQTRHRLMQEIQGYRARRV